MYGEGEGRMSDESIASKSRSSKVSFMLVGKLAAKGGKLANDYWSNVIKLNAYLSNHYMPNDKMSLFVK